MLKETKRSKVLNHLKKHGSITSWTAIQKYGATRLSAIIFNLREESRITKTFSIKSVPIERVDSFGNKVKYANYIYLKYSKKN